MQEPASIVRRRRALAAAVFLCAIAGATASAPAFAAPDFSTSSITVEPAAPLEGDVVTFTLRLRNSGADDAGWVYVDIEWPLMGFLVDAIGVDGAEIDHAARQITLSQLPLPAGAEHRVTLRVLAPRDSGGDALGLALRMSHFDSSTNHYDRASVTIDTRLADAGVPVGGVRVTRAGLVVFGVLGGGLLLWLVLLGIASRRPRHSTSGTGGSIASRVGPGGAAAAITVAVGFWTFFGAMAWRDYQSLSWPATTCTILGGRLSAEATTAAASRTTSGPPRDTSVYVPVLGLKYMVEGRETLSSGYDTGSRLGIGGRGGSAEELARWHVGAETPCWYAPGDPLDIVVRRGFGGAYLFALFPLPVFWIGLVAARAALSRS